MNSVIPLGKFERIKSVTEAWPTEAGNFTPWLAEDENLELLGEALGMELEREAVEYRAGSLRVDLLARVEDEPDHRVIIENQFGGSDHKHLGQILSYLAAIDDAKTVVWIAEKIEPEQRAAVDWPNEHTTEEFSFFAIEIELWKIADSPVAPRFNVIASPNDWTRSARSGVRQLGEDNRGELALRYQVRLAFWGAFAKYLKAKGAGFQIRHPTKYAGDWFSIGRANFGIIASISIEKKRIGVELYMSNDSDKSAFRALLADKEKIEGEFGEALQWQELEGKKASRIVLYRHDVNPADASQYEDLHDWMLANMERFRKVFTTRVKSLPSSTAAEPAGEEDDDTEAAD
jgi:hypothetical protein